MTRDEICTRFIDAVPYQLYPYQEEALLAWFGGEGGGVMVCAPTGMGKTLIAEAALFEALHSRTRLYYTTPLIALTEQKYREFRELAERWGFSRDDVGFITGNRRENPSALVRVVVAEILLNHLLGQDAGPMEPQPARGTAALGCVGEGPVSERSCAEDKTGQRPARHTPSGVAPTQFLDDLGAVVMDEFHNFNDPERGVVWELSLVLLARDVRVMLLSATVGNPYDFADWLKNKHGRKLTVVVSNQRRVPLEYVWVGDRLFTELLPAMASDSDAENRTPALAFCFNRDECWELAERLKGLPLVSSARQKQIEAALDQYRSDLAEGAGPKLRQMLLRGVGVHHAGVLPRHKEIVETLFNAKLVPFVVCTETLAAGINLPARSVVLRTLLTGKPREKKLIPASAAHQMFGRAGRPQFDTQGYVYAVAHDDDVKIAKWRRKYEQLDPNSKDPGILRARKELERKRPTRRSTEQYWSEGQFRTLIAAGPAKLFSRSMIPYSVLIFLLTRSGSLADVRRFLETRFTSLDRLEKFQTQLDHMINNLAGLGFLSRAENGAHVTLDESIRRLLLFRSIDPLYGDYLAQQLAYANLDEKLLALDSVLELPPRIAWHVKIPPDLPKGPLQTQVLEPLMMQMGIVVARAEHRENAGAAGAGADEAEFVEADNDEGEAPWERPPTFPEMLKLAFEARLAAPEPVYVQPKWVVGDAIRFDGEFFKLVRARDLVKQEGLVLRHLLRAVLLAGEFFIRTEDPDYQQMGELATKTCQRVDAKYTARFLEEAQARAALAAAT